MYVFIRPGQSFKAALKRFKNKCEDEGLFDEMQKRRHFVKPGAKRRAKHKRAVWRQQIEKLKDGGNGR